jgi:L-asparaginase II
MNKSVQVIPAHVPLLVRTRGPLAECIHYGSIAVCDRDGALLACAGDPEALNFTRSALKPFQALPFIDDGGAGKMGFDSHDVALMCASHSGEAIHLQTVRRILARCGAAVDDLKCGSHVPYYYSASGKWAPAPASAFGPVHHNCSGKHAGFLAFCRLHGHGLADYLAPDGPLQARIRNAVQECARTDRLASGIDGCGAPNFAMPLARLAFLYMRLASSDAPSLAALRYAMTRHPDLVSGTGRTDLALVQAGAGDWVVKAGADGVQAIGVRSRGLGIAIRIADGDVRARHVVTVEVLRQLGLLADPLPPALAAHSRPKLVNLSGTVVGGLEPLFQLGGAAAA